MWSVASLEGSAVEITQGKTSRKPGDTCPGKRVKIFTIFRRRELDPSAQIPEVVLLWKRQNENRVDNLGTPALECQEDLAKAVVSEFEESLKDSPPTSMGSLPHFTCNRNVALLVFLFLKGMHIWLPQKAAKLFSSLDSCLITKFMENISEEEQISIIKVASELVTAVRTLKQSLPVFSQERQSDSGKRVFQVETHGHVFTSKGVEFRWIQVDPCPRESYHDLVEMGKCQIGRWKILRMKFLKRKKPQVRKHNEAGINRRDSLVQLEYTCYFVD
ncbi:hypothetical protein VULLAG_LOCUS18012 [Vulpes lagopus]